MTRHCKICGRFKGSPLCQCRIDQVRREMVADEKARKEQERLKAQAEKASAAGKDEIAERQGRREATYPERSCSPIQSGGDK